MLTRGKGALIQGCTTQGTRVQLGAL